MNEIPMNERLQKSQIENRKGRCERCNKETEKLFSFDGDRLCRECFSEMVN